MKNPLVSVVVPVYNADIYLVRCLDSLVNQTFKNIQVILVDDGSTDQSGQICDRYVSNNSNFEVIHKKNGGLSSARNEGIKYCKGKYITFLDSDDWFSRNYIEICALELEKSNVELLLTPYIREYSKKSIPNFLFSDKKILFNNSDVKTKILVKLFGPGKNDLKSPARVDDLSTAWGKFYIASKCKKIKFVDTKKIGTEDVWFNINYVYGIKSAEYIGNVFYHYYKENSNSLVRTYNSKLFDRWCVLYNKMYSFIKDNNLDNNYYNHLNNRIICNLIGLSDNIFNSNLKFLEKYKNEKAILNQKLYVKRFKNFSFSNLTFSWKIFFKLCYKKQALILSLLITVGEHLKGIMK